MHAFKYVLYEGVHFRPAGIAVRIQFKGSSWLGRLFAVKIVILDKRCRFLLKLQCNCFCLATIWFAAHDV